MVCLSVTPSYLISSLSSLSNFTLILFVCHDFRGYKRFYRRTMLESSTFVKDDCLKINCTVGVVVSAIDSSRLHSIHVPDSDIGAHFGTFLENGEGSDVTFIVSGVKFPAHKLVLAARSPEFGNEFFSGLEEDNQEIVVNDMEPKVFKVALVCLLVFRNDGENLIDLLLFSWGRLCCTSCIRILLLKMRSSRSQVHHLACLLCLTY